MMKRTAPRHSMMGKNKHKQRIGFLLKSYTEQWRKYNTIEVES